MKQITYFIRYLTLIQLHFMMAFPFLSNIHKDSYYVDNDGKILISSPKYLTWVGTTKKKHMI